MNQEKVWNSLYNQNLKWNLESQIPNLCKDKVVLELGVGTGKSIKSILNQKPKKVYAIDFSKSAIEICQKQFKNSSLVIEKADVLSLPYQDNFFDVVICSFVLNNIEEKEKALAEIHKVLKKTGLLFFQDFAKGDYREESFEKEYSQDGRYCHFFTTKEINKLFNNFKTKSLEITESHPIRTDKSKKRHTISGLFEKI